MRSGSFPEITDGKDILLALTILFGSSVSAKNEALYDTILREAAAHPELSYVLLVPEQASLYTQEEMVRRSPNHALMNIDVLTFNRLAYRVFEDLREPGKQILDDTGKLMLLRLVVREMEEELSVLRKNIRKQGFLEELKSLFSELSEYNVSPEKLLESAKRLPGHPGLVRKLSEISAVYGAFLTRLHRDYEMAEERLSRLSRLIPSWQETPDTVFALLGFTGFTPPQESVIEALLPRCRDLVLLADLGSGAELPGEKEEESLFHMSYVMCAKVRELAIRAGLPIREEKITEPRAVSDTIAKIEAGLFRWPQPSFAGSGKGLRILCAKTPEEEVRTLVSEILGKLREGYRLRDMAVISGDPKQYHEELEDRMRELQLPVFFDETRNMSENPLFLLIRNLMEVFTEEWSCESVTVLLKNPLVLGYLSRTLSESPDPLSPYERVCELENFCLARGIRGKSRFQKPFSGRYRRFAEGRLDSIREIQKAVLTPVSGLHEKIVRRGASVGERIEALREFLAETGAEQEMERIADETKRMDLEREYRRSFSLLSEFFDRTTELLSEERMATEAFSELLLSGISALRIGLVPPAKDELIVGDLLRTRLHRVRFLYVLGANEGVLVRLRESGGLLSEQERELLSEAALTLAPTSREEGFSAQFYLYRLLTSPSEELYLSYAQSDGDGRKMSPAPVVGKLLSMFPDLRTEDAEKPAAGEMLLPGIGTVSDGLLYAAESLRERMDPAHPRPFSEEDLALSRWMLSKEPSRERMLSIFRAAVFSYQPEKLSEGIAARLFGSSVQETVSRLERYAACPFAHFLTYGLSLTERPEYRVEVTDLGTMLHDSINAFFVRMNERGFRFSELTDEDTEALSDEAAALVTENYGEGLMQDSERNRYLRVRIRRLVRRTAEILRKQWQAGDFETAETEVPFGWGEAFDALRVPVPGGGRISLAGRIDRLDLSHQGGKITYRIIDFKSGRKDLDYTRAYYGLQLQLLIYMEAARTGLEKRFPGASLQPAGVYYYHIDDPMVEAESAEKAQKIIEKQLQLHGITNSDPAVIRVSDRDFPEGDGVVSGLRMKKDGSFFSYAKVAAEEEFSELGSFARKKAAELTAEMQRGEIPALPYRYGGESGCSYCAYRSVCGFDARIPGYRMKRLQEKTLQDLLQTAPDRAPLQDDTGTDPGSGTDT